MNNPKITVVTVCYNAVNTIEETILSVINQTYQNVEFVIVDGASTDGTLNVINKYRYKVDVLISESDNGVYDAMNKAVKVASGDWLFFLNSDDTFYNNDVLSEFAGFLISDNTIYYADVMQVPDRIFYGGIFNKWRLSCYNICHQSIFYPKVVFEKYLYNTNYRIYADWNLNIECFADKSFDFQYVHMYTAFFSTKGLSYNAPKDDNFRKDYSAIISRNFGYFFCLSHLLLPFRVRCELVSKKVFALISRIRFLALKNEK